ncbi:MAG TPA: GLPGLI family protein [Candidatus Coprenecus merdigallinarum]|nr:GLPGLI family protein [Candidatus Coprenecus merdigallinarum]
MDSLGPGHGVGVELEELKRERAEQMAPYGDLGGIGSFFYRSVMSDYRTGIFKVAIPDIWAPSQAGFSYSLAHIYEEEAPALEWEMTGEHGTVASFECQKAECDFRGRRWEAWFTPEIPVSEGPWKLKGLPGLILYARDTTGQYSFEAVSVTDSPEPFYDYVYEHEDRTTYRRFKRYERSCFRWPKSFKEETTVYIVTGKGIEEADYRNWRMPYYPMEWP